MPTRATLGRGARSLTIGLSSRPTGVAAFRRMTGGQYSLVRVMVGLYLLGHWAIRLVPLVDAAGLVAAVGVFAALLFAIGWFDRLAAIVLIVTMLYSSTHGMAPSTITPFFLGVLLIHLGLPRSPYGAWSARGRVDPGNQWRMPRWAVLAAWILLISAWWAMIRGVALSPIGVVVLHLFAIDPRWIPAPLPTGQEWIFYDGHCGLCHGAVRFVLAEDRRPQPFRFAPLDSEAFIRIVPAARELDLPDSIVVLTDRGEIHTRSGAVLHVLRRLGGFWRVAAEIGRVLPEGLLDLAYDGVARVRRRLFATPADVCPIAPPALAARFER